MASLLDRWRCNIFRLCFYVSMSLFNVYVSAKNIHNYNAIQCCLSDYTSKCEIDSFTGQFLLNWYTMFITALHRVKH